MKITEILLLSSALCLSPAAIAQDSMTSATTTATHTSAKQDMKDAGHDTKAAAKDVGHATKKTTKKVVHKSAQKTDEGAQKVEDKTAPQQ